MQPEAANIYDLKNILENEQNRVIVIYNAGTGKNPVIYEKKDEQNHNDVRFTEREK